MVGSGWLSNVRESGADARPEEGESMRKRLTAVALAGTVGLGAVGATAVAYPALADSSKKESPQAGSEAAKKAAQDRRTSAVREALKGLVDDKTLTAAQADKVASTLGSTDALRGGFAGMGRPGVRPGGGLLGVEGPEAEAAAAKVLGISAEDLRTELRKGTTLAQLAKQQGKDVDTLVNALVAAAKDRLAASVKAGRITQAAATQIEKTLEQRVRDVVQNGRPALGGMGGHRFHGPDANGEAPSAAPNGTAPDSQAPTPGDNRPKPGPSPSSLASSSSFRTT
jgi:hypothetical protein